MMKLFLLYLLSFFLFFSFLSSSTEARQVEAAWKELRQQQREMDKLLRQAYEQGISKGRQQQQSAVQQQMHDTEMKWLVKLDEKNKAVEHQLSTEYLTKIKSAPRFLHVLGVFFD